MKRTFPNSLLALGGCLALALSSGCASTAQDQSHANDHAKMSAAHAQGDDMMLPEGWTAEDMQACMLAGTPGPEHARLAKMAGTWSGTQTMWMGPGGEPATVPVSMTVTSILDGRYVRTEWDGDMPGMGPFHGLGFEGFDNVTRELVCTWIDNHGTGIMQGRGQFSEDGTTRTIDYRYNCPITKKIATMREIERQTGPNSYSMEMYGTDPKTGVEYKMFAAELTRSN